MPSVATMPRPSARNRLSDHEAGRLVGVGERQEDRALGRQERSRSDLGLVERPSERVGDAHDLAGRAHLRPERRVDLGEPAERQDGLLDGDVAADRWLQQTFVAQLGQRRAEHDPCGDLGERDARGLGDERHRPTRTRVGLDDVHRRADHGELHVDQTAHVERAWRSTAVYDSMTSTTHDGRVGGGIAHAESPECTPASSTCSITPPISTSPV